ncbi:MAG: ATP-binding cassette domain-containing protein [Bacteroidales bacterium]|nr:ATP-binding cassette domain-containing protein [Bacteroidales bacterium]
MILEAQHIEKKFGDFRALDDVSVGVRQGSIFGLLGPNGAGKTTLIRLINRILRPDKGVILLDGSPMTDSDVQRIGYLPEERGLYKKMKVGEQAVYLAQLKGLSRREAEKRLIQWFEKFEIASWWNRPVEELSKGMQQKVQFIVTVLHEPSLLIFDEPFSGFDPVNATLLKNEILALRDKGATVIFSTHNMASVEELCDDIALINKSKVVLSGSVSQIRRSYSRNLFEVVTLATINPMSLPAEFRVQSHKISEGEETFRIALPEGSSANSLLSAIMPQRQIVSIKELLPSMNDIFVETVKEGGAE